MRFSLQREVLLKPLAQVVNVVERRHTLPILANVLLEPTQGKLYVTATDLEMQITAHSDLEAKDGTATTVAARKLHFSPGNAEFRADYRRELESWLRDHGNDPQQQPDAQRYRAELDALDH